MQEWKAIVYNSWVNLDAELSAVYVARQRGLG